MAHTDGLPRRSRALAKWPAALALGAILLVAGRTAVAWVSNSETELSRFDLGIDVSDVVATGSQPQYVADFLATLEPLSLQIILSSCHHYLTTPMSTKWRGTKEFCAVALEVKAPRSPAKATTAKGSSAKGAKPPPTPPRR